MWQQLTSLLDEYRNPKKEGTKNLVSSKPTRYKKENPLQKKIKCFQEKLNELCDISTSDCYQTLRFSRRKNLKNDWAFYQNQKSIRTQNLDAFDRKSQNIEMQRKKRDQHDLQNHRQGMTVKEIQDAINLLDGELESTDGDEEEDYQIIPSKRKKSSENVSLSLPAKELSKVMSQVFDRSNISVRKQLLVQSAIINSGGESVDSFSLSVSSVWRQRAAERKLKAKEVENYLKNKPKYTTVHWDSKLTKLVSGKKEERVAILVSGASSGYNI